MMKKNDKLTAVVVGHDHQNTLGVIRSLGEGGFRVWAVLITDGNTCATAHSRYLEKVVEVPFSDLLDALLQLGDSLEKTVPLIPCGDEAAAIIDKNAELLQKSYLLPYTGNGSMFQLMNKMNMLEAAKAAGLNVPRWVSVQRADFERLEGVCESLRFPVIVKPIKLLPGGTFSFHIVEDHCALCACLDYVRENCGSVIFQEYIRKTAEYGVNGCRLRNSGQTIFGGMIEKKRFSQISLGSTTAGTILPDTHGLSKAAKRFVEYIDYRGVFDMEFITDGADFYFVEMNFRNGGYGYAYTKAGRNFPAIWAGEASGEDVSNFLNKPLQSIFFINESADLQNVRAGKLSVITWITDVVRARARLYINCKDLRPLLKKVMRK